LIPCKPLASWVRGADALVSGVAVSWALASSR
jgi:hypothetical protein